MLEAIHRQLLMRLDPETAHDVALAGLRLIGACPSLRRWLRRRNCPEHPALGVDVLGLHFRSRIGLAAGFDKNAVAVGGIAALGFGFAELGTVTPEPEPGAERPRVFRLSADQALINRMRFPNVGVERFAENLRRGRREDMRIGVNVSKNVATPPARAAADICRCIRVLGELADFFVINVSSPNSPGLRDLQDAAPLRELLAAARATTRRPVLIKIAPDLTAARLDALVAVAIDEHIDGIVATNTTTARPPTLRDPQREQLGGLSGAPLRERATQVVRLVRRSAGRALTIIAVGGVFDDHDVRQKLHAGADLVELYSGLVFGGPATLRRIHRGLLGQQARAGSLRTPAAD